MDTKIKEKWIEALESGEFKQGRYRLKNDDCYCCLGVLCELVARENPNYFWEKDDRILGQLSLPPQKIYVYTGLEGKEACKLAQFNDDGKNFKDIANYIRNSI